MEKKLNGHPKNGSIEAIGPAPGAPPDDEHEPAGAPPGDEHEPEDPEDSGDGPEID